MLLATTGSRLVASAASGPGGADNRAVVLLGGEVFDCRSPSIIEVPEAHRVGVGLERAGRSKTLLACLGIASVVGETHRRDLSTKGRVALRGLAGFGAKDKRERVLAVVGNVEAAGILVVDDLPVLVKTKLVGRLVKNHRNVCPLCCKAIAKQDLLACSAVPPNQRTLWSRFGRVHLDLNVESVVGVGSVVVEQQRDLSGS